MKVDIQSIHFTADYRLKTFYDGIKSADVYLRVEKDAERENKTVEIKLNINGNPIFAKEQANTFEAATDLVMDKVVAQVKKHKEKIVEKV